MLDFHKALLNKEPRQHRKIQTKLRGNRNFLLEKNEKDSKYFPYGRLGEK